MADRGTVGAGLRSGWAASSRLNVQPSVPGSFTGGVRYGAIARAVDDSYPRSVNPILQRRGQVLTADPLLTSD